MAILKIARMGHPVLKLTAVGVADPTDRKIVALVDDMIATMQDASGTGLAAPQVHVPLRVVVFKVHPNRAEDGEDGVPLTVLINPEIEPLSDEKSLGWEGCLSLPDMMGEVARFTHIRYWAYDLNGHRFEREAHGYHARVVQHECDHLDGILYPYRIENMDYFGFNQELSRSLSDAQDDEHDG